MAEIGIFTIKRLFKRMGAPRVSEEAASKMSEYLEKELGQIVKKSVEVSQHSGRNTVTEQDVRFAFKNLKK